MDWRFSFLVNRWEFKENEVAYDNTNSGTLFRNDRRQTDKQPEFTGSANIEGRESWVNAWVKQGKNSGKKFFSLSFKAKEPRGEESQVDEFEEDVPF